MSKENSKLFRALPHFVALCLCTAPAFGQIYRWVDEKGVTHYGAEPPRGANAREIEDKLATPPGPGVRSEDWQRRDREFRQRQIQAGEAQAKEKEDAARRREMCNEQRDLLARLKQSRTYTLNDKGERVFEDETQRQETIARQEKIVAQLCPSDR